MLSKYKQDLVISKLSKSSYNLKLACLQAGVSLAEFSDCVMNSKTFHKKVLKLKKSAYSIAQLLVCSAIHENDYQAIEMLGKMMKFESDIERAREKQQLERDKFEFEKSKYNTELASHLMTGYIKHLTIREFVDKYFSGLASLPTCELQDFFYDNVFNNICCIAPRGHGKTIINCIIIPIYLAIYNENRYILQIQATKEKTSKVMESLRDGILLNEKLCKDFNIKPKSNDFEKTKFTYLFNGKQVHFHGVSMGASIRGLNWHGIRPEVILIDDLYNDKNKKNSDLIEEVTQWYHSTVYNLPAKPSEAIFKIVGTKFHKLDIFAKLEHTDTYKHGKFKAILDDGTPLWKAKFTIEELRKIEWDIGTAVFNQEYQGIPLSDLDIIVKPEYIHYDTKQNKYHGHYVMCIDPAVSEKDCADFTAIILGYQYDDGTMIIEAEFTYKKDTVEVLKIITGIVNEYNVQDILVESVGGFKGVADMLARELQGEVMVRPMNPKGLDKHTRLATILPVIQQGKIKFNKDATIKTVSQLLEFPTGEYDDLVDTVIYMCQFVRLATG